MDERKAWVYLTLMTENAPQREYALREVFNGLRYNVREEISWRMIPNDLPPDTPSISKCSGGWKRACLKRWFS
jgi:transposase